jgi:hypothetical protein
MNTRKSMDTRKSFWTLGSRRQGKRKRNGFRRLNLEQFEDRRMLATYTFHAGDDNLTINLDTGESLTVTRANNDVTFALTGGTFTQSGGDSLGTGSSITVDAADLANFLTINNSIAGAGTNNVTFSGDSSLDTQTLTVAITNTGTVGAITFSGGFDITASNTLSVTTTRNISVGPDSVLTGGSGGLTLSANQQDTPTAVGFVGILIDGATVDSGSGGLTVLGRSGVSAGIFLYGVHVTNGGELTSAGGNVSVTGTSLATGGVAMGVRVDGDSQITAGGTGTVTVIGQGGAASTDNSNRGVFVTGDFSRITSNNGNVSVSGTAGGIGSGTFNIGVYVESAGEISAGGTGTVEVTGIGGNTDAASNANNGVLVIDAGSKITSGGGSVTVTGYGRGTSAGGGNRGVILSAGGIITAGGMGAVNVIGFGSTTSTGSSNNGVHLESADSAITSSGGAISIQGTAGTGTGAAGFGLFNTSSVTSVGSANITITADSVNIASTATINGLTNTVTLRPLTAGTQINLGGADSVGVLGLTSNELNTITAGTLVIGRNDIATGTVTVSSAIAPTGTSTLSLITASNITGTGAITETNVALRADTGISLTGANDVSKLALNNSTSGTVAFHSTNDLVVSTVDGLTGVKNAGNLTLSTASGANLTVEAGINGIQSSSGTVALQAGQDLLFGSGSNFGDARGQTVELSAGRDIIVSFTTYVQADGSGGMTAESGRDLTITSNSLINTNADGAPNRLTTGTNGLLTINAGSSVGANNGAITVTADDVALAGTVGTGGIVTVRPVSAGRAIDLGTNTAGSLSLTDAELNQITAGTLDLGDEDSGDMSITAAIALASSTDVELRSGGDIVFAGGSFDTGGGNLLLAPSDSPAAVKPTTASVDVTANIVSFASDLEITIHGTTVDTEYTQFNVAGEVDLSGVALILDGSHTPLLGQSFVIVAADSLTAGTFFSNAAQGATLIFDGVPLVIDYDHAGGTVTLAAVSDGRYDWGDAANTLFVHLGAGQSLTVSEAAGLVSFSVDVGILSGTNDLATGNGTSTITINGGDLATSIIISNSAADAGTNNVTFSGVGSLSTGTFQVDLTNEDAVGTIAFTGGFDAAASANLALTTSRNIALGSGSNLTTADGDITLEANTDGTTTGNFVGINVNGAVVEATGTGSVTLIGQGGDAGANEQIGVQVVAGGAVRTDSGMIDIDGQGGGSGSVHRNYGVRLHGEGSTIATTGGSVTVTGSGGNTTGSNNKGILVDVLTSFDVGGTGSLELIGVGGSGTDQNAGVEFLANSSVTVADGDLIIAGTGGGSAAASTNRGVFIGSSIDVGGSGMVTITGTGGVGSGGNNQGILFETSNIASNTSDGVLQSASGQILIEGTGGSGTGSEGLQLNNNSSVQSASGNITLIADHMNFNGGSSITAGDVALRQRTAGTAINLGGADGAGTLGLTDTELNTITAGMIQIGDSNSGDLTLSAPIVHQAGSDFRLVSGANILFDAGSLDTGGGTLLLAPGASPAAVRPTFSGTDATASTVSFASDLAIVIDGDVVDAEYTQLNVAGTVDLTGVKLKLGGDFPGITGWETFTIVSATNVTGTFVDLPHGTVLDVQGKPFVVQYSPTDVQLVSAAIPAVTTGSGNVRARPNKGSLVVTGDNAANSIRIVPGDSPGEWLVIGIGLTTVNGKPQDTISGVTRDVLVDMRGGDDYVLLENATAERNVRVNMGAGGGLAVLVSVSTGRHVSVLPGRGGQLDAYVLTSVVGGNLHVCGGGGSDRAFITDTTVQGNMTARLGGGADELQIRGGVVGRDTIVQSGAGNDTIGIQGLVVQRDLRIDPCHGDDVVSLSDIGVSRHATIRLNRGLNTVEIDRMEVFARFALSGGRDADRVLVGTAGTGGLTADSASFSLGSGDDTLVLLDSLFRELAVDMGAGSDECYLEETEVTAKTRLRGGRGGSKITEDFEAKNDLAALDARDFDQVLAAWT